MIIDQNRERFHNPEGVTFKFHISIRTTLPLTIDQKPVRKHSSFEHNRQPTTENRQQKNNPISPDPEGVT
jgi:hypothetical protein